MTNHIFSQKTTVAIWLMTMIFVGCEAAQVTPPSHATVTSGRVNSHGKFSFQYGRIDASIKLPRTADGLWPAFWLMGADYDRVRWPQCAEIDVLEMGSRTGINSRSQERFLSRGTHWGAILSNGTHPAYAVNDDMFYSLQDDFHLYTMIWNENAIRMYLDLDKNPEAEPYYEMLIDSREGEYAVADYFHKPFFIIFNLAVGGDFPQIYTIEEITALNPQNHYQARMYIDYVNVYDLDGHLIWQDAFDGETLDESHWNIEVNDDGGGNHELQSYRRQNVSVETDPASGKCCLILTASQDGR